MSKKELKELESKMEGLSKQLGNLNKLLMDLHIAQTNLSSIYSQWIEEQRKKAEETEKKHEILLYYRSLAMGLLLGIFGNMFVSYLMKALDILQISSEGWLLATFVTLVGVLALIWMFNRDIKKLSKEIPSS